jgi:hypothetical protein
VDVNPSILSSVAFPRVLTDASWIGPAASCWLTVGHIAATAPTGPGFWAFRSSAVVTALTAAVSTAAITTDSSPGCRCATAGRAAAMSRPEMISREWMAFLLGIRYLLNKHRTDEGISPAKGR